MTDDEIKEASARCPSCNRIVNEDRHCCGDPPAIDNESERLTLLREQRRLFRRHCIVAGVDPSTPALDASIKAYLPTLVSVAVDAGEAAIVLDESRIDASESRTRIIDTEEQ